MILEYYPGIILKENLKKSHIKLLELETFYISKYNPPYNILKFDNSLGYKHNINTIEKISEERKLKIGLLNKNRIYSK
jgi:hypothetical protein